MIAQYDELREQLLPRLRAWRRNNIHIGLSPRVSPLWRGLLYREPRGAIAEYARLFDTAMVRFGPWRSPDAATLARMREQAGEHFAWTAVIEDEHMTYRFAYGYPDRRKRGEINPYFLDSRRLRESVFPLLQMLQPCVRVVVLKVGPVYPTEKFSFEDYRRALTACMDGLPATYRYAVESSTPRFVLPEYLACLREREIIHIPAGVPLLDALQMPGALRADICVLRSACLAEQEEGEEWIGLRAMVRCCLEEERALYAYLLDGEGAAQAAEDLCGAGAARLTRLLSGLDPDLARRSPIKRKAA